MALAGHPQSMLDTRGQVRRFALSGARLPAPRCIVPLADAWWSRACDRQLPRYPD
jgi:hypothetical protein